MALSPSSTAAAILVRRCLSSTLSQRSARLSAGAVSVTGIRSTVDSNRTPRRSRSPRHDAVARPFSAMPPPPAATPPPPSAETVPRPASLAAEAGLGAQDAMKLVVEHGLGKQKLTRIAADKSKAPLVDRWQRMIAAYLETQCHVIALLGYPPDEHGIRLYTQQLSATLQLAAPEVQEQLRVGGRDTYRLVLATAFDVPNLLEEQKDKGELGIVEARNIMHKVSLRMQAPEVLEKVARQCSASVALDDSPEAKQIELARKHTVVQEAMVDEVYLSEGEGGISLVEECGFGAGEEGYVRMQSMLAEYQGDPLINQYVGAAMAKLLQSAGIDMQAAPAGES